MPLSVCVDSYQDQSGEQGEEYETEEQLQARILTAALEFIPLHGWTVEAIAAGAEVSGAAALPTRMRTHTHTLPPPYIFND